MFKGLSEAIKKHEQDYPKQSSFICHTVSVVLLYLSALILLGWLHLTVPGVFDISFAWFFMIAIVAYYAKHCWKTAIGVAIALLILNMFACFFPPSWFGLGSLFVILLAGIALEIAADSLESRKPDPKRYVCVMISSPPMLTQFVYQKIALDKLLSNLFKSSSKSSDKSNKEK